MVYGPFLYDRAGGDLQFLINKTDPATGLPFDNVAVTAVTFRLLDPSTTPATVLLGSTAGTWDSVAKQWKLTTPYTTVVGKRVVLVEMVPTRAASTPAALWPETRVPIDVSDLTQDIADLTSTNQAEHDATQAQVTALQSDFDSFEVTNQAEHDATQTILSDAAYGLSALNTDLDLILTRLGVTADTGGSATAGTAMAKLNAIQANLSSAKLDMELHPA